MKGITLCADCVYYDLKKHKCNRGATVDPDILKGQDVRFYVDCPLPDVEPLQKWIPCSERLPESVGNKVLVFCTGEDVNDYVGFGHYENFKHIETWYNLETSLPFADWGLTVTHWMPLPEPPEQEQLR